MQLSDVPLVRKFPDPVHQFGLLRYSYRLQRHFMKLSHNGIVARRLPRHDSCICEPGHEVPLLSSD